jgi:cell division protein ZapA
MPQIEVTINAKKYTLSCADGEENQLRSLAAEVDTRVLGLAKTLGAVNDSMLFLLTAITFADEKREAGTVGDLQTTIDKLDRIAARLQTIADRVAVPEV